MPEINLSTNGTVEGTKLTVDGKDITKKEKVIEIMAMSSSPFRSSYDNELIPGNVSVSYTIMKDDETTDTRTVSSTSRFSLKRGEYGIGEKIKSEDQIVRYVGTKADQDIEDMVDSIIEHCEENNVFCIDKETLLSRSEESLKDKISDLGVKILDAKKEYYAVKASETEGDQPKYPINNCDDVKDAWKLRGHAKGLKISKETLEKRIKRRAKTLGCKIPGSDKED